jgi:lysyl-tRNA synthetase class 2
VRAVQHARAEVALSRSRLYAALRADFLAEAFLEVETPLLVPAPGMEPQITAFEVPFLPETAHGRARTLYLHTSPEYAMKRLLAEGFSRIWSITKVFRNGEIARDHNPEFSLLEFYRTEADYTLLMDDVERQVLACARALGRPFAERHDSTGTLRRIELDQDFERLTVREAVKSRTGIDLYDFLDDGAGLARAAREIGVHVSESATTFDDVFFSIFLERVERTLGWERPTFLIDYPRSMASLSRLKPADPRVAERFELYVAGLELCNGFSELTDGVEQRARLQEEQALRASLQRPVYPLDEAFLEAVGRMPPAAGVAVGLDRLLMLLLGKRAITEVLLFPAFDFVGRGEPP